MTNMKKWFVTLFVSLVLLCNISVQATEQNTTQATETVSTDAIITKCNQVMNQKKVIKMTAYMESQGQKTLFMDMAVDLNTKITYTDVLGIKSYVDENTQLIYMYTEEDGCWYVCGLEESGVSVSMDDSNYIDTSNAANTTYTYKGITTYQGIQCETIGAVVPQSDVAPMCEMTYYINANTYELVGTISVQEGIIMEIICAYPESVTIPTDVVNNALMMPETTITDKNITYTAVKSGKNVVLKVTDGKKVKSSKVTIPDSVTYAGKQYSVVEISDKAFQKNSKIKKVTIGKNVKKIGKQAFYKCKKLNRVTIKSSKITKIGSKAFYGTAKKLTVKAPKSKVSKYKKLLKQSNVSSNYTVSKN